MNKRINDMPDAITELPSDESPHAVSLFDAKDNQCRWPVNPVEGQFMFCGDVKAEPHSYCARHCLRAFNL